MHSNRPLCRRPLQKASGQGGFRCSKVSSEALLATRRHNRKGDAVPDLSLDRIHFMLPTPFTSEGAFLLEESAHGAIGTMTGFAYPEAPVNIYQRMKAGDTAGAREIFCRWMPPTRYENQPGIGLSVSKHIMMRRGLHDTAVIRAPGPSIDEDTEREQAELLASLDLERV